MKVAFLHTSFRILRIISFALYLVSSDIRAAPIMCFSLSTTESGSSCSGVFLHLTLLRMHATGCVFNLRLWFTLVVVVAFVSSGEGGAANDTNIDLPDFFFLSLLSSDEDEDEEDEDVNVEGTGAEPSASASLSRSLLPSSSSSSLSSLSSPLSLSCLCSCLLSFISVPLLAFTASNKGSVRGAFFKYNAIDSCGECAGDEEEDDDDDDEEEEEAAAAAVADDEDDDDDDVVVEDVDKVEDSFTD